MEKSSISRRLREISDELRELTGEGPYAGSDANGYYFDSDFIPNSKGETILEKMEDRLRVARESAEKRKL